MKKRAKLPGAEIFFNNESIDQGEVKTLKRQDSKELKQQSVKVTLYLSVENAKALEQIKAKLFAEKDIKATRSTIVNAALESTLKDIESLAAMVRALF